MSIATPELTSGSVDAFSFTQLRLQSKDIDLIDVRSPAEFQTIHAQGARLVPLDKLQPREILAERGSFDRPVYLICKSGQRAAKAREKFVAAGFSNAMCIEGGTDAWLRAGLPVVRGKARMSLERQVRIAAGSLVVISVALGVLVNPWLFAISGFIGAGLIFSGITDTCGMGMMLAKMPWNNRGGSCP